MTYHNYTTFPEKTKRDVPFSYLKSAHSADCPENRTISGTQPTSPDSLNPIPHYPPALLHQLHQAKTHFVLCNPDKSACEGWSWKRRTSLRQVLDHASSGGLLGYLPKSLGCSALDVDRGDPAELMFFWQPRAALPSGKPGRWHLLYDDDRNRGNGDWEAYGASGQRRSGPGGYLCLWAGAGDMLMDMLRHLDKGHFPFPEKALHQPMRDTQDGQRHRKDAESGSKNDIGKEAGLRKNFSPAPSPDPALAAARPATASLSVPVTATRRIRGLTWLERIQIGYRNTSLFDAVRWWAYPQQRGRGDIADQEAWYDKVQAYARDANEHFPDPLPFIEAARTAYQVARFTWNNPDFRGRRFEPRTREQQRYSQWCQVAKRREQNAPRDLEIIRLREAGRPIRAIVREHPHLGSRGRVEKVLRAYYTEGPTPASTPPVDKEPARVPAPAGIYEAEAAANPAVSGRPIIHFWLGYLYGPEAATGLDFPTWAARKYSKQQAQQAATADAPQAAGRDTADTAPEPPQEPQSGPQTAPAVAPDPKRAKNRSGPAPGAEPSAPVSPQDSPRPPPPAPLAECQNCLWVQLAPTGKTACDCCGADL